MRAGVASLLFVLMVFSGAVAWSCTTFRVDSGGSPWMGKSYDWDEDEGMLMVNPRGLQKKALVFSPRDNGLEWVSKFSSVTFNQYGREMPNGGMNEKGLAIEVLWLKSTRTPKPDKRPAINELQWIQHALDQYESVEEMVKSAPAIRVAPVYAAVHYFACDARECATFEYIGGKLKIHHRDSLVRPVLANHTYKKSVGFLGREEKKHKKDGEAILRAQGKKTGSRSRFIRAALMAEEAGEERSPTRAFEILDAVSVGKRSVWNIVYDLERREVHYRTKQEGSVKIVPLDELFRSCGEEAVTANIHQAKAGDAKERFGAYDASKNHVLIQETTQSIRGRVPRGATDVLAAYPMTMSCVLSEK